MLGYVVCLVHTWKDRRSLSGDHVAALKGAAAYAAGMLVLAGLVAAFVDARQFIVVRQIAELGSIATAVVGVMALNTLRGRRK